VDVQSRVNLLLRRGIAAVKAGRADEARALLAQVLELDRGNEQAWLWMTAVTEGEERLSCLKTVLAINPHNEHARLGLESLLGESLPGPVDAQPPSGAVEAPPVSASPGTGEGQPRSTGRACATYGSLSALGLLTIVVCVVAAALGRMALTEGGPQAQVSISVGDFGPGTPLPSYSATPAPSPSSGQTLTPTATRVPIPTNTLVVPEARIPGLPIVSDGAYDEIEMRMSELRDLDIRREVPIVTCTRYRLEDYLFDTYLQEDNWRQLEVSERIYQVLGLLDEDYDLVQALVQTQRDGLAGLYDSEQEEIYLILDRYASDLWLEITFAHEFAHALQDQHFDLDALYSQAETMDSRLALQALVEGDATLAMTEYAFEHLFGMEFDRDLLEAIQEVEQGEYQDAPGVVRETAWFPYEQGIIFAAAMVEGDGWAKLNEAFRTPPDTTEQIMHPDKYLSGEGARIPEVGDPCAVLGPGWAEWRRDVVGELFIRVYLEEWLSSEEALIAGVGWDGDRLVFVVNDGADRYALVLRTTWDSASNAEEFFSLYLEFMRRAGAGPGLVSEPRREKWLGEHQLTYLSQLGSESLLLVASDEDTLDAVLTEFPAF
jgi:hypothetical protein